MPSGHFATAHLKNRHHYEVHGNPDESAVPEQSRATTAGVPFADARQPTVSAETPHSSARTPLSSTRLVVKGPLHQFSMSLHIIGPH